MLFVDLARAAADVARGNFLVFAVALGGRLDVHYYALDARGDDEGGVFDVGGFFAEYGAQKLFFGRELGLRLRGNLADENVAGLDFRADADNAVAVEVFERLVADIGNVARDFLGPELGVAGGHFVLLNVDGSEHVVFYELFGEQNCVLKVVAVPRHEGDQHVLAERELSVFCGGAVGEDCSNLYRLPALYNGLLGEAGAGVGTHEFAQLVHENALVGVALYLALNFLGHLAVGGDYYPLGVYAGNLAGGFGKYDRTGVRGDPALNAGSHKGSFGFEERHALALHVRTHERAVGVVVFEERNDARRDGNELLGADVHIVDVGGIDFKNFVELSGGHTAYELAVLYFGIGLRHGEPLFVVGG